MYCKQEPMEARSGQNGAFNFYMGGRHHQKYNDVK